MVYSTCRVDLSRYLRPGRPRFAQKYRSGINKLPRARYLNWSGSQSTSSMGLSLCRYSSCYSNSEFGPAHLAHWLLQSSPLRTRRPRQVPDQPKYHQDLLSWPRPIRLVLTVPCTTSVRPVPTVPVPRPCVQCRRILDARASVPTRTRPHASGICDHAPVLMPAHFCPYVA